MLPVYQLKKWLGILCALKNQLIIGVWFLLFHNCIFLTMVFVRFPPTLVIFLQTHTIRCLIIGDSLKTETYRHISCPWKISIWLSSFGKYDTEIVRMKLIYHVREYLLLLIFIKRIIKEDWQYKNWQLLIFRVYEKEVCMVSIIRYLNCGTKELLTHVHFSEPIWIVELLEQY